jgi:hypothetical protein
MNVVLDRLYTTLPPSVSREKIAPIIGEWLAAQSVKDTATHDMTSIVEKLRNALGDLPDKDTIISSVMAELSSLARPSTALGSSVLRTCAPLPRWLEVLRRQFGRFSLCGRSSLESILPPALPEVVASTAPTQSEKEPCHPLSPSPEPSAEDSPVDSPHTPPVKDEEVPRSPSLSSSGPARQILARMVVYDA